MRWYQGDISQAVTASKQNGSVFVVYLEGKNGSSQDLTNLINDAKTCELLETKYFVAIKIEMDSISHQQFSQIYKEATVPSIFFIGKNGSPLEVVKEGTDSSEFLTKLWAILSKHGVEKSTVLKILKVEPTSSSEVVSDGNTCIIKEPDESSSSSGASETNLSSKEKLDRAKELVIQKREAKRLEEEENERLKELERRKAGQNVQSLKRWQQDNEMKELLEERNKDKKEKQEAKKRVLDQIAQDRLERASKFANVSTPQNPSETIPSTSQVTHRVVNSNVARLQFKLPDGSSHTHEFSSSSTLHEVREFINTNLNLSFRSYTLSTTFPRREFTEENSMHTLVELELVPNAVILILPIKLGTVSTRNDSWITTFFWSFVSPFLNFFSYIKARLFGGGASTSNQNRKRPNAGGDPAKPSKKRTPENLRTQGNVHRLNDNLSDSDDDNNTWNGNSTQQM